MPKNNANYTPGMSYPNPGRRTGTGDFVEIPRTDFGKSKNIITPKPRNAGGIKPRTPGGKHVNEIYNTY